MRATNAIRSRYEQEYNESKRCDFVTGKSCLDFKDVVATRLDMSAYLRSSQDDFGSATEGDLYTHYQLGPGDKGCVGEAVRGL